MKAIRHVLILFLCVSSCSAPNEPVSFLKNNGPSREEVEVNVKKAAAYDLLLVEIGTPLEKIRVTEHHLHGRFFQDRAEFYVVKNPELHISNSEVKELTLYFIDGTLCKKKYELDHDISTELIKSYGGFRFLAMNQRTREVTKSEPVVLKTKQGSILNDKLDRYQMKWDVQETTIKYRLNRDSKETEIFLEEELSEYKHVLAMASGMWGCDVQKE